MSKEERKSEKITSRTISSIEDEQDDEEQGDFGFWRRFSKKDASQKDENVSKYPIEQYTAFDRMGNSSLFSRYLNRSPVAGKLGSKKEPVSADKLSEAISIPEPNIPSSFRKSDIDLFLYAISEEQAEEKIRHIYNVIKKNMSNLLKKDETSEYLTDGYRYNRRNTSTESKILFETGIFPSSSGTIIDDDLLIVR